MRFTVTWGGGFCTADACDVATGEKFTLAVEIVEAPAGGYIGAQTWVEYGDVLSYDQAASTAAAEIVSPACSPPLFRASPSATGVGHGCLTGLLPPLPVTTYVGEFVRLSISCPATQVSEPGRLVAVGAPEAGTSGTAFVDEADNRFAPKLDKVTINCVDGLTPPPTLTPTDTPTLAPGETPQPTATPTPGATPSPTATLAPGETPAPTATLAPGDTPLPTATLAPGETPQPTATLAPGETPLPTATPAPGQTPAPTATLAPPTSTPAPGPTAGPGHPAGDANCDGVVDPIDSAFILQWWAGLLVTLPCSGDSNGDGATTVVDATLILQFTAGLLSTLPP